MDEMQIAYLQYCAQYLKKTRTLRNRKPVKALHTGLRGL